ncbi:aldehyde dehydrogenase family protein [Dehalobacter sp. 14DCB1]|uniref:aldehyde dehydrogenase family protein n=1 Tax=Dehalobacter sp. 14DCB1 TaxID=2070227 RepID=UPI001048DAC0|nr:aldehyde dehydrogenase family protein [Dehalobacter sp. 14DCB1]TCX51683.1 aldehyde dehydrogenase [Dehalobacter sp. 14DCB1]
MKAYDKQYINGEWRTGKGKTELSNYNPYTGELLYSYRSASSEDINDAYEAAAAAQKEWAKTSPGQKREMLEKLVISIMEMKEEVYACLTEEAGATGHRADFEYSASIKIIKDAMRFPFMMDGKILPSNIPGKENYIFKKPKGVIGVIAPWNVPLVLAMRSVIPAIATGNAVVLKPATDTPGSAFLIADFFDRAGFPKGLMNAVAGKGSEIGDLFVQHPVSDLISFTGSTEVGQHVGEMASGLIKDVSLELGGNNVMMVMEDADLLHAANAAIFGAFFNSGQVCMALNRILVVEDVYDKFVEIFVTETKKRKVGNPMDPETFIGPVINKMQVASVEKYIQATIEAGATVKLEGKTEGNVISPWIFTDVTNDMPAAANEAFGPVCCVIKVKDEDEAISVANASNHGLSGSVFTKDLYRGMLIARQIKTGMIHVNDQSINDEPHVMFGGEKSSGVGRFNAQWVVDKFTTEQWVSVQLKYRF